MAYTVELKPAAVRDLKAIPERDRKRIKTRIDALAENPRPHGVKALQGGEGYLRLRVGDYRIIYTVLEPGAPRSRDPHRQPARGLSQVRLRPPRHF